MSIATIPSDRIRVYRLTVTHANYTAAAQSEALDLTTLVAFPANVVVIYGYAILNTVFSGGGTTAAAVQLGDAGVANELLTSTNVFTGQATGLKATINTLGGTWEGAYVPLLTMTVDAGHTVANLDAGSIDVEIVYMPLPVAG